MSPIRVLVVDDSGFMRCAIRAMVAGDPDISIAGEASNGVVAIEMAQALKPDVITMDVVMPLLDGVSATRSIMRECPTSIIMVSDQTQRDAQTTFRALAAGAVDFISKSSSFVDLDIAQIQRELREKILCWGRRPMARGEPVADTSKPPRDLRLCRPAIRPPLELAVVGASTGGPRTIALLLNACGRLACPMVVAQHMPSFYTASFAEHLAKETGLDVREGEDGLILEPGMVIIVPGGKDGIVGHGLGGRKVFSTRLNDKTMLHPNVDILFESAIRIADRFVAVLLTGMGDDGMRGASRIAACGHPVIVQDPATCVVGGMPQAAIDAGAASHVEGIEGIGRRLKMWCG